MQNESTAQSLVKNNNFICDLCSEEFDSVTTLEEHKLRHGRPGHGLTDTQREMRGDIGAAGMPTSPIS